VYPADSRAGTDHKLNLDPDPLRMVGLTRLINLTQGKSSVVIGLVDGPVVLDHPNLNSANIHEISSNSSGRCSDVASIACIHGTFIAGMLCATRGSVAPGICPECTLLVRPIFAEMDSSAEQVPSATPTELAQAIFDVAEAGARIINLSAALVQQSPHGEMELGRALDHSARKGIVVVVAAGNQGTLGSSVITRHPWVIPVVGYGLNGRVLPMSNLGSSIGRRGIGAAAQGVTSLRAAGGSFSMGGTSVAAPFVTGTVALLWSCFPDASAAEIKLAITGISHRHNAIVPPLLDAGRAYEALAAHRHPISLLGE
jgi:subtilisin family serine protease